MPGSRQCGGSLHLQHAPCSALQAAECSHVKVDQTVVTTAPVNKYAPVLQVSIGVAQHVHGSCSTYYSLGIAKIACGCAKALAAQATYHRLLL
jgi:hypothetical protein